MKKAQRRREEMARLVELWKESGESRRSFASQIGVSPSKLAYWEGRVRRPSLVPLKLVSDDQTPLRVWTERFEIVLENGRRILVPPGFTPEEVRQIVEIVVTC
jgi:transcriptional regulator with XRE-family HTH domain